MTNEQLMGSLSCGLLKSKYLWYIWYVKIFVYGNSFMSLIKSANVFKVNFCVSRFERVLLFSPLFRQILFVID